MHGADLHPDKLSIKAAVLRPDIKFLLGHCQTVYQMFWKTVIILIVLKRPFK